ncbi:MAG: hypothetical protein EVA89_00310 [Sandaracinaceae bacterium]|nr:MAG: hypothetical protein EVA89_00310 [Sandaracinaceae bacterium]
MTEAALEAAILAGEPVVLSLTEIGPTRILERLAEDGGSYRVIVDSLFGDITVEVGTGLVVGAVADKNGERLQGRAAYALLRKTSTGDAAVEPLRFPSLANILEPVHALPDLMRASSRPPGPPDTVEVTLPARGLTHENITQELELPPEWETGPGLSSAWKSASAPTRAPSLTNPELARDEPATASRAASDRTASGRAASDRAASDRTARDQTERVAVSVPKPASSKPSRRRAWLAAGGAVVLAVAGLAFALTHADGSTPSAIEPGPAVATDLSPSSEPVDALAFDDGDDAATDAEPADEAREGRRVEARRLARAARRALRRGHSERALRQARRAARLRGGLPYYQVLLGDALHANGQPAAARRAYRRALRMSPRYAPAVERLGDARNAALGHQVADRG